MYMVARYYFKLSNIHVVWNKKPQKTGINFFINFN